MPKEISSCCFESASKAGKNRKFSCEKCGLPLEITERGKIKVRKPKCNNWFLAQKRASLKSEQYIGNIG